MSEGGRFKVAGCRLQVVSSGCMGGEGYKYQVGQVLSCVG